MDQSSCVETVQNVVLQSHMFSLFLTDVYWLFVSQRFIGEPIDHERTDCHYVNLTKPVCCIPESGMY